MFVYKMPTEIVFGRKSVSETGNIVKKLGRDTALIITDEGIMKNNLLNNIEASLKEANIMYLIFHEVEPDPTIQGVKKATELLKEIGAKVVIGVGGGSSIDTAKAVATMATNEGEIFDYE